jgi:iron complex outermembrane receptor protein
MIVGRDRSCTAREQDKHSVDRQGLGVRVFSISTGVALALSTLAFAQTSAAAEAAATTESATTEAGEKLEEIVVTGTMLRGVAPAGANEFSLDTTQIQATNAQSTAQVLAQIPQLNTFGTVPTSQAGGIQLTVNRVNLRNLPQGVGGSSPTLVLMDGHRLVGMGVNQSYPDPDIIPPALIERVDVLTDGGSAIYGADAVGGVVNFITKKNFEGLDVGVREGLGLDSYRSTDVNVTTGKSWGSGSAYIGYSYSYHDPIYGSQRDYVKNINYTTGLPGSQFCNPANAVVGGATYAVVGGTSLTLSNANLCDPSKTSVIYPQELRNSVMAGFRQEAGDSLEFDVKGYFSERNNTDDGGPLQGSGSVTSTNPNYISTGGGSTAAQTVYFNFAPVGGRGLTKTDLSSSGITPGLTWKIGHDWQMRAYYNYGQSRTEVNSPQINQVALTGDITAGTINPYNIAKSTSAALGQVLNYTQFGIGKDKLSNAKAVFDGPLFGLPGGDLRMAVGTEYSHEHYEGITATDTTQNVAIAPLNSARRDVMSGFAELDLPLLGPSNNVPLIYSFDLAAAVRYDHYSDFGGNWAPNFGMTLKPISWIGVRARFNRSFQAPSLVQLAQATTPTVGVYPGFLTTVVPLLVNPAVPPNGGPIVAEQGTVSPLEPQRSRAYNLGFDISPPLLTGLSAHFTYYNIQYEGQISAPALGSGVFWGVPTFENLVLSLPTLAQIASFLGARSVPASLIANTLAQVQAQGGKAYYVADIRARNLGLTYVNGFDVAFNYSHPVPFGTVYASFNSSYTNEAINAADGVTFTTNQAGINSSRFNFSTVFGTTVGESFRGQLTWNHLNGFSLVPPAQLGQTSVAAFNTVDLYSQYDLKQKLSVPITLSLGITNVFNTNPPVYYGVGPGGGTTGAGYAGTTLGRVFYLGAEVKL